MNLKDLINEGKSGKNVHLEHLEDEVINRGTEGAASAIYFLRSLRDMLSGHVQNPIFVSTKWDGAPAIIAGINPENGRFFVGTKGVFAVSPKLNYSEADIDRHYPDRNLGTKLKIALKYLSQLGINGVLQGDMMYTKEDLKKLTIQGEDYLAFQPNTILYAIPYDSALAKKILASQLGIVFHTKYTGDKLADMKASFDVSLHQLNTSKDVWFRDARFVDASGTATFTESETQTLNSLLRVCESYYNQIDQRILNYIAQNETIKSQIKMYNNSKIKEGQHFGDARKHILGLIQWVTLRLNQNIIDAKKSETIRKREAEKTDILTFYKKNFDTLMAIFNLMSAINDAKLYIVKKLQTIKGIGKFIVTDDGFKVANDEGFVAVDHNGIAVKLVDRLEFSRANFNTTKNWQS